MFSLVDTFAVETGLKISPIGAHTNFTLMPDQDIDAIHIAFFRELEALRPNDVEGGGS